MGLLAVLLIVVMGWLLLSGRLQRMTVIDGIMVGVAIIGIVMLARGRPIVGAVPLVIAGVYGAGASDRCSKLGQTQMQKRLKKRGRCWALMTRQTKLPSARRIAA